MVKVVANLGWRFCRTAIYRALIVGTMLSVAGTQSYAGPNPYCVAGGASGGGSCALLGLPASCQEYSWGWPDPNAKLFQMPRPFNGTWVPGQPAPVYWGYDKVNNRIGGGADSGAADRVTFSNYIAAHPGMIWIIGNEPNMSDQDNLTDPLKYAQMFKCYYDFISSRDPKAKFTNGALCMLTSNKWFPSYVGWYWKQVLNEYRTKNGKKMPLDMWNMHLYPTTTAGGYHRVFPTAVFTSTAEATNVFEKMVKDFCDWAHTVDEYGRVRGETGYSGPAYAGTEVIITEFNGRIGNPASALTEQECIAFVQYMCPRLVALKTTHNLTRFFWFIGYDRTGAYQLFNPGDFPSLLKSDPATPTALGLAYAALANNVTANHTISASFIRPNTSTR